MQVLPIGSLPSFVGDGLCRQDGNDESEGYSCENESWLMGIHEHAENERRRRECDVCAGIHQAVDPAKCAFTESSKCALANQHVARR